VEALGRAVVEVGAPLEVEELLAALRSTSPADFAAEYQSLFGGKVAVAPYEGSYELDPLRQGRQMADIAGFYRAFGAEAHGPAAERPDHLGCELEFLSLLELKRVLESEAGDDDGAELADEIAAEFLRDHAGRWLPTFFADVRSTTADGSPLAALAALGERLLADELERRALVPSPLPRRHASAAVEQDSFDCGTAA
jgi:TorA maturation chaperone TorD